MAPKVSEGIEPTMKAALDTLSITPVMLRMVAAVDTQRGRWEASSGLAHHVLCGVRAEAEYAAVAASLQLDGIGLGEIDVAALVEAGRRRQPADREARAALGYHAALRALQDLWRELSLTSAHVGELHGMVTGAPRATVETDLFRDAAAAEAAQDLLAATQTEIQTGEHHPVLVASLLAGRWLALQPLKTSNAPLARLLVRLVLLRSGYAFVPYGALEAIIYQHRAAAYRGLRRLQSLDAPNDWMVASLRCLVGMAEDARTRLAAATRDAALPPLSEALLRAASRCPGLTLRTAVAVTGANRNTVKVHVRRLVASGCLVQYGRGRGTWYEVPRLGRMTTGSGLTRAA